MFSPDKAPSSTLRPSREQIEQVQQVLEEPLSDKQVMIPFTTRAFFPGTLQPSTTSSTTAAASNDGEEQVLVRMAGDHLVEMHRIEARDYLKKRAESCRKTSEQHQQQTTTTTTSAGRKAPAASSTPIPASNNLPCFEIREEYDEFGKQVKAEAVNVMKELEYLQRQDEATIATSDDVSNIVKEPSDSFSSIAPDVTDKLPAHLSDEQYNVLSSRLDELARREEEAETAQKVNKKSAKKLQGGWAKGFLNKKKTPGMSTKRIPNHQQPTLPVTIPAVPETPPSSTATNRKVGFRQEHEVREIPRVGERSASELRPTSFQPTRKPIESDVFSGVIRERTVEESEGAERNARNSSIKPTPQKKKLSRFARERMQGGMS